MGYLDRPIGLCSHSGESTVGHNGKLIIYSCVGGAIKLALATAIYLTMENKMNRNYVKRRNYVMDSSNVPLKFLISLYDAV